MCDITHRITSHIELTYMSRLTPITRAQAQRTRTHTHSLFLSLAHTQTHASSLSLTHTHTQTNTHIEPILVILVWTSEDQ